MRIRNARMARKEPKNTKKRIAAVMTAMLLAISPLCGCSGNLMGGDYQLMRPPYPAGEEKNIQEQLTKSLGSFVLKYPKNGGYRSAIIQTDLTGDNRNDALVFYRKDESTPVSLAVLCQKDGRWQLVSRKEGEGGEVERVMFGDINGDGVSEIIVGWIIYSTGLNIISAYSLKDSTLSVIDVKEYSEARASNIPVAYSDMQIYDFDSDGSDEIIASYVNLSEGSGTAKLIECHLGVDDQETMSVTDTAPLDGHVIYYNETKVAKLTDDNNVGVVLDGYKDNSTVITEFIYWDASEGDLKTPFYIGEEQAVTSTARHINIASRDIDFDGVIDIPVTEYLPGYDETSENPMYLTTWYSADFGADGCQFINKKKNVINTSENYSVTWQSSWNGSVTCRLDESNRILYFYRYQKDRFAFSEELFRIKVFTKKEWEQEAAGLGDSLDKGIVIELAQDGDTVYAAFLSPEQRLADAASLQSYFSLM